MSDTVASGQLRAFVERIERLEAEIKDLNADKSEVYKELRGVGFDVKAVRQCVAARKLDSAERQERDAIFDLYWEALTGASRVHVHEEQAAPADAAVTAGTDLREPVAAVQGQIIREGDAPREPSRHNRGDASSPDTDFEPPAFLLKERKPLRPLCLNPSECAGYGQHTCHSCLKAAGQSEAA